ncbi:SNF2-related protein [Desulfogranum marinum]|uniref:SNF2-related protein n=1 Tax=Desulfogranum marinum TaxID=453220 RepID=UPI00196507C1|nr:DEAD/DEAH box helicase [Desulfogranum marinum]MBM9514261.1 DEAD/DEAH box helicase [Desulfogranum marinum]
MTTAVLDPPDKEQEEHKTIQLADFLDEWGAILKAQVIENMDPVYTPKAEDAWDQAARKKMINLVRPPFESQIKRGILPVARSLYKEDYKAATLVGEMGTGKTFMGLAIAFLDPRPNKRICIQCPGHLVKKWIREAQQTIPDCVCHNLNNKSLSRLIAHKQQATKPVGTEVWVIGKERAKLHFQRKKQTIYRRGAECCPECGQPIEDGSEKAPICEHCHARMWAADRDKVRRYAKAEFIKRFLPKNSIDLLILDELHELKGGGTAQGQAMSCLTTRSRKVLSLTGTLMGGYAKDLFFILWRMFPRLMKDNGFAYGRTMQFAERYGVVERTYDSKDIVASLNAASIGRKMGRSRVKESPGISPLLLPDLLLERSAFVRLADISDQLPDYDEIIVPVDMVDQQREEYDRLANELMCATQQALACGDMRLLGKMLQALLAYPDGCRRAECVTLERNGIEEIVGTAEALNIDFLPKEAHLLQILQAEKREGRKAAIFVEHTGTRDLLPELTERLAKNGISPLVLRSQAVKPEHREEWLKVKMATGLYDCLLCNPNLVKTGLDLLEFPTIVFFQCGYSVFTLRQASRRSWRIGQDKPVRVFFMAYAGTMQDQALSLMAQKMETSLAVEGELSGQGLAALSESENSMMYELAKALTGKQSTPSMTDAWTRYTERSLVAGLALDDDQAVEENTTTTIQTTTTIKTATGSASITREYVVRGKVHIQSDGAVVYVNRNRFDLQEGNVFWNGRKVGWYDRQGCGEINQKPIRIYRPERTACFVLAEVREKTA